jgi:hypothetical protein
VDGTRDFAQIAKGLKHTFFATPSFLGAAFFLVTPVGFAAFAGLGTAAFLGALGLVVRLTAGAVSTTGKTRGLALPVCERVPSRGMLVLRN